MGRAVGKGVGLPGGNVGEDVGLANAPVTI